MLIYLLCGVIIDGFVNGMFVLVLTVRKLQVKLVQLIILNNVNGVTLLMLYEMMVVVVLRLVTVQMVVDQLVMIVLKKNYIDVKHVMKDIQKDQVIGVKYQDIWNGIVSKVSRFTTFFRNKKFKSFYYKKKKKKKKKN